MLRKNIKPFIEALEQREMMDVDFGSQVMQNLIQPPAINSLADNHYLVTGDFDRNGYSDVLYIQKQNGTNRTLLNSGNGQFLNRDNALPPAAVNGLMDNHYVLAGDFDKNGFADVLYIHKETGANRLLLNSGNGQFLIRENTLPPAAVNGLMDNHVVVAGDFDKNGYADVLYIHKQTGANRLLLNSGNRQFLVRDDSLPAGAINGLLNHFVVAGDFDGNGYADVLYVHAASGENRLLLNGGNGNYSPRNNVVANGMINQLLTSNILVSGDFDRNGRSDLFYVNKDNGENRLFAGGIYSPASVPSIKKNGDVVRNQYVFNPFDWAVDGYRVTDIRQSLSGICVIASSLASAANAKIDFRSRIAYLGNFQYRVYLYEFGWQTVRFDGWVYTSDLIPETSRSINLNGQNINTVTNFWPLLMSRAYLQAQGINWATDPGPNDKFWDNGFLGFNPAYISPKNAGFAFAGGVKNNWDTSERIAISNLAYNLRLGSIITVGTNSEDYGASKEAGHQWAVLGLKNKGGVYYVELYNPWGTPTSKGLGPRIELTWSKFMASFTDMTMVTPKGRRF